MPRQVAEQLLVRSAYDDGAWRETGQQWARSLRAANRSPATVDSYIKTLNRLAAWVLPRGVDAPEDMDRQTLEEYFGWALNRITVKGTQARPAAVAKDYRHLRVFFKWLVRIDDRPESESIMVGMTPVQVPKTPVDIFTDDELRALVKACSGREFTDRRDMAMMRLLLDTGVRRAELTGLMVSDLDMDGQKITVIGKGDRLRVVSFGIKAMEALDIYLRARRKHKDRARPELWLAGHPHRGALGYEGINQMLQRRARIAGVNNVFAHRFRHTAASAYLEAGGNEGDMMQNFGWQSREMVDRYGASAAARRAIAAARKLSVGDRI